VNQALFAFLPALLDRAGTADVVVATSPPLTIGLAGWLMARRRGVPLVFDVRDLYPAVAVAYGVLREGPLVRVFDALARFVYARSALVVVASHEWEGILLREGLPREKLAVITNGANTDRFRPGPRDPAVRRRYGVGEDRFLAGYVGLLGRAHGAEVIVGAAERLRDDPRIHMLIVGEGVEKGPMQARAEAAGLTNITFAPSVPAAEVPSILNACDAGIATIRGIPLTRGAIPIKLFEQMACGLPVTLAGWGDAEEILRDAQGGLVVPCGDEAGLAGALRELARDPEAARAMGRKGRAYVEARYDRRKLADDYLQLLASLEGSGGSSARA
jgi:glycosyltransferase involved in cell wall biosynthesis